MDFLAPYTTLDAPSLSAFVILSALCAMAPRLQGMAAVFKNLVAGTITTTVALVTGSLGGILVVELSSLALGLSPIQIHEFLRPALQFAVIWFSTAYIVTIVLGIGNAGLLVRPPRASAR